jgi:hypothetical protein
MLLAPKEGLLTLKDLTADELYAISFTNLLKTVNPPFRPKDFGWIKGGVAIIKTIDACTKSQLSGEPLPVDLLDFINFLRSEDILVKLHYGNNYKVKGISFTYRSGNYSGYHLGENYTFPAMCKLFLVYDPDRHTEEALTQCNHQATQPKMGIQGKMLNI